ncbi:MAG: tetratricopeptide repeat protein [Acidobacteriota bacterium]
MARREKRHSPPASRGGGESATAVAPATLPAPAFPSLARSVPVHLALLALLATLAYGGALTAGVAWDDGAVLSANPAVRTLSRPWTFFTDPWTINPSGGTMLSQYRPLRTLAYALQFAVFGGDAWGYHLVSILLHGACAWAVGALAQRLFGRGGWLAASLWLLHPALSENALYLAAQGNLLCLLFAVLAVSWHLDWLDGHGARWRAAGLAAALLAMLSYEFGAMLVALVPLAEVVRTARGGALPGRWWMRHAPLWLLLGAFLAARASVVEPLGPQPWWGGSWGASLVLQLRLWAEGWRLTLLPFWQLARYEVADAPEWAPAGLAVVLHLILAGVVALAFRRPRLRIAAAAIAWWYLAQAPTANVLVPNLGYPFAPRFLFLALVLPLAAFAAWFAGHAAMRPRLWWAAVAVLVLFVPADRRQTAVWQDWRTVFTSLAANRDDDLTARFNLANAFKHSGEPARAIDHLEAARRLDPTHAPACYSLAEAYLQAGRADDALAMHQETLRRFPWHLWARLRLAERDLAEGRHDRVRQWLAPVKQLKGWPPYARARAELAVAGLAAAIGDCSQARGRVDDALSRWTHTSDVFLWAGTALARCGDAERGRELRRRGVELVAEEGRTMVGDSAWLDY